MPTEEEITKAVKAWFGKLTPCDKARVAGLLLCWAGVNWDTVGSLLQELEPLQRSTLHKLIPSVAHALALELPG